MTIHPVTAAQFRTEVAACITGSTGKLNPRRSTLAWWTKNEPEMLEDILKHTGFIDQSDILTPAIHCYISGIDKHPTCHVCGAFTKYTNVNKGFQEYCSNACVSRDKDTLLKRERTMIDRYGYVKDFRSDDHVAQAKATMLDRFGTENPNELEAVKQRIQGVMLERYGETSYTKTEAYRTKSKQTNLARYGEDSWTKTAAGREKTGSLNRKISDAAIADIIAAYLYAGTPIDEVAEKNGFSVSHMYKILRKIGLETDLPQNKKEKVPSFRSIAEQQIVDCIREVYTGPISENNRKIIWPYEVDILLPECKLAIEFNGNYWHSDKFKDRNFHATKCDQLEALGYRLISVFEHQWFHKQDIILANIRNAIKSAPDRQRVMARSTKFREATQAEANQFYDQYHIQGSRTCKWHYALIANNRIVAMASFSSYREGGVELIRYCTACSVVGGFSKLLKNSGFDDVYSYASRNYSSSSNNMYLTCGFKEIRRTAPSYVYTRGKVTLYRTSAMKHKLPAILGDKFDKNKTEYQNMTDAGWSRVWDCGNILYRWKRQK